MKKYPLTVCTIVWLGDEVLMSQRLNTEEFKGYWQCPGGKVDPTDDSIAYAASREVKEETNLFAYAWNLSVIDCIFEDPSSDKHFIFNWGTHPAQWNNVINKEIKKASGWKRFKPAEALKLPFLMPGLRKNLMKKPLLYN